MIEPENNRKQDNEPKSPMSLIGPITLIALLLCACSSDEPAAEPQVVEPEAPQQLVPISFSGSEEEEREVNQGAATKAMMRAARPLSELAVTTFNVWGHKDMSYDEGTAAYGGRQTVFPGFIVNWSGNSAYTTTSNTHNWEYVGQGSEQTIKYWDFAAKAYRFFAVTKWEDPGTYGAHGTNGAYKTYGVYEATGEYPAYAVSMKAKARVWNGLGQYDKDATAAEMAATPYFTRLWFSNGNLVAYPDKQFGKPVQLEFLKPYARVRYIYKYVYPREGLTLSNQTFKPTTDYTDEVDDKVKIPMCGTVTVIYPLTGTATREWYTVTPDADNRLEAFTEDFDAEDDTKVYTDTDDGWYMVLPCTSQGSYKLQVTINTKIKTEIKTETKSCVVPAEYMRWLPGYSYTYIFKINEEGGIEIELVEAAVTPWTELGTARTVYNW